MAKQVKRKMPAIVSLCVPLWTLNPTDFIQNGIKRKKSMFLNSSMMSHVSPADVKLCVPLSVFKHPVNDYKLFY